MATKNAVEPKKEHGITIFDASIFEQDAGKGLENIGQEDLALPFVKVLSGNDPVLDENEEARKGDIYNTVTGKVYKGKTGISVIPCAYQRRFIQWAPRGSGTGAPSAMYTPQDVRPKTERSPDDNKDYVVGGNGEYLEETHQHFVLILNEDGSVESALIAMKSTQLKKSRKWNSIMASRVMKGAKGTFTPPRYSHIYRLKTIQEENSKGSWHGWEMSLESQIEDAAMYTQAKKFSEDIMAGDVVVKHHDGEDETNGSNIPF